MAWSDTWGKTQPTDAEQARHKADQAHTRAMVNFWGVLALMAFVVAGLVSRLFDRGFDPVPMALPLMLIMVVNATMAAMNYADARYYRAVHDRLSA